MKDRISALMDGELDDTAAAQTIDMLTQDREALDSWRMYHLISDALRDTQVLSAGFASGVAAELAKEPTVLAPRAMKSGRADPPRRALAWAAGMAAVALVGWLGFAPQQIAVAPIALAPSGQGPTATSPTLKPAIVPLPSGTNDYLLAHQGFSPRVSLQGMAPYVRTVSEQPQELRK
jgi:sigma-E factor negative regulatory protein RseA